MLILGFLSWSLSLSIYLFNFLKTIRKIFKSVKFSYLIFVSALCYRETTNLNNIFSSLIISYFSYIIDQTCKGYFCQSNRPLSHDWMVLRFYAFTVLLFPRFRIFFLILKKVKNLYIFKIKILAIIL